MLNFAVWRELFPDALE